MFLLFGAFIAGILTVLAPCILALLPIIVGGSLQGNVADRKRPVIIAFSLAASILFFTVLLKATSLLIDIDPKVITYISGSIIVLVGLLTLFPNLYATILVELGIEHRAQGLLGKSFQNKSEFIGPVITGVALGPVFSSCSPVYAYILATVLPVNFAQAMAYIFSYIVGLTLVLLLIGYYGQRFIGKIKFASDPRGLFQRVISVLFIVVGLLVFTGLDKRFQTYVSQNTPFNFDALSSKLLPASDRNMTNDALYNVEPYQAPEFTGLSGWINSEAQTMEGLRGKVVLVDFWTYSCINCIRNNPYIESWYQKYKDQGFVVVGSHAPEFAFEKNRENVQKAVRDQGLNYPVALDNDFATWNAFGNRSWPTAYLIDAEGMVRRVHEGEGEYAETEEAIRGLLSENGANLAGQSGTDSYEALPIRDDQTPETYLGLKRASNYEGKPALGRAAQSTFAFQDKLNENSWSLSGGWEIQQEKIIARGESRLRFNTRAKDVYIVAASDTPKAVGVKLNGKPVSDDSAGDDVKSSMVTFGEAKLYRIISLHKFSENQLLELEVPDGVELTVFTFGS